MNSLRSALKAVMRAHRDLIKVQTPLGVQKKHYGEGPPQPFDNLPFSVSNRYAATIVFTIVFGTGLWAPFLILWYSMAKRTL